MRVKKLIVCFMAGVLFSPVYCRAEDEDTSSKVEIPPFKMEEVIVTASRYREGLSMIPANVTVIGQKDIINSTAQDIPGLLQNLTGLPIPCVGRCKLRGSMCFRQRLTTAREILPKVNKSFSASRADLQTIFRYPRCR